MKKKIMPISGLTFKDVADGKRGYFGREIVVRRSGVDIRLPYTVTMALDAEIPDQTIMTHKMHYGGRIQYIEEFVPEDKICAGANVYHQVIQKICADKALTRDSLELEIIFYYGFLPDAKWARQMINNIIDEMIRYGYLAIERERVNRLFTIERFTVGLPITTKDEQYELVKGFEPNAYHILKYIHESGGGGVPISELKMEFMTNRRWVRNNTIFSDYMQYLELFGCIEYEGENVKFIRWLPKNLITDKVMVDIKGEKHGKSWRKRV